MILLNFSHPLTENQLASIEEKISTKEGETSPKISQVIHCQVYFENDQSFLDQVRDIFSSKKLSTKAIQTEPILVVLPSHSFIAGLVLAELHGRMGHLPAVVRIGPVPDSVPVAYQVSEIVDLQVLRDAAKRATIYPEI